jgi:hypothetical protein
MAVMITLPHAKELNKRNGGTEKDMKNNHSKHGHDSPSPFVILLRSSVSLVQFGF